MNGNGDLRPRISRAFRTVIRLDGPTADAMAPFHRTHHLWFNEPSADPRYERLLSGLHGLILETSI